MIWLAREWVVLSCVRVEDRQGPQAIGSLRQTFPPSTNRGKQPLLRVTSRTLERWIDAPAWQRLRVLVSHRTRSSHDNRLHDCMIAVGPRISSNITRILPLAVI